MRLPKFTCPLLDSILKDIDYLVGEYIPQENRGYWCDKLIYDLKESIEDVRSANQELRSCAEHYKDLYESTEAELQEAKDRIDTLEDELRYAQTSDE